MKFLWTTLAVSDMNRSIQFYEEIVGLQLKRRNQIGPGVEIAFLGTDAQNETVVELHAETEGKTPDCGKGISMGFTVEDLDAAMALMKEKGIEIVAGPIQPNPKIRFFFIEDPNGVRIQFVQQEV